MVIYRWKVNIFYQSVPAANIIHWEIT